MTGIPLLNLEELRHQGSIPAELPNRGENVRCHHILASTDVQRSSSLMLTLYFAVPLFFFLPCTDFSLWYLLPFYATWIFPVATEITEMATGKYYDPMVVLVSFFLPFQGALNFLVYMRPRYLKYKNQHPEKSFFSILARTLKRSLCCIKDEDDRLVTEVGNSGYFKRNVLSKFGRRASRSRSAAIPSSIDNMVPEENNVNADAQESKVDEEAKQNHR